MSASDKTWANNNPPACEDDDLNGFKNENNNLIEGSGQILNTSDNQQTHKAVSAYAAHGDFYSDTGGVNAYVLGAQGSKVAPPAYADGMRIRWATANASTGPSTVNVAGLGVKDVRLPGGGVLIGGEITAIGNNVGTYNASGGYVEIEGSVPQATETFSGGGKIATKAEQEAAASDTALVTPLKQIQHPSAAKAWVNFNGTGVVAIRSSLNVSSITDDGIGDYGANLAVVMSTATDYVTKSDCRYNLAVSQSLSTSAPASATLVDVRTSVSTTGAAVDADAVFLTVYGDLA